jgi:cell division protein FtsN
MSFGLALGLLVALAVYVTNGGVAGDSSAPPRAAAIPQSAPMQAARESPREAPAARFDFYEILPQYEVVIPEIESEPRSAAPVAAVEEPGRYVLQVGSFAKLDDADRRRANLALLGIESRIQRVTIDEDVFHRVRIGPIDELAELNRIRARLRSARVESLLMKVPNGQ